MDDTCCILRKGDIDGLLTHLNSILPTIKFTMEVEEGGSLAFLDARLQRREDGRLDITVYRNSPHTLTGTCISSPIIQHTLRGDWQDAFMIRRGA